MQTNFARAALAAAVLFGCSLNAQEAHESRKPDVRTPGWLATTVALRSELYKGQPAVILRRPARSGGDLILLSGPSVTPELLATAAVALSASRENSGDQASSESMMAISEASGVSKVDARVSARVLEKLRVAPRSVVANVGEVQTTIIYLPSKTGRESLKQRGKADFTHKDKKNPEKK